MRSQQIITTMQTHTSRLLTDQDTIVVADDDPAILDALKIMLELYNYHVETIQDGKVVSRLSSLRPKLLLLDICMSGVDGREICKKLKSREATKDIPVILISASCNMDEMIKDSGADDCLSKPFEMQQLLSKVKKYILN
jgi:CheY-like chemotaxis protein